MADSVIIAKTDGRAADDPNCFNRLHHALAPVAFAKPGDLIVFETRDCFDNQFGPHSTHADVAKTDLNVVHPMSGPVFIEGAKPGDALAVTVIDITPSEYGCTTIIPGFGFLRDLFDKPFLANWKLDRLHARSPQIPGVTIPYAAFTGCMGVVPDQAAVERALRREAETLEAGGLVLMPEPQGAVPAHLFGADGPYKDQALRTIPPREFGGNMDIKEMQVGTTILFPCFVEGAGIWTGDVHYAQGDGEVCGAAIEMDAVVTLRCEVLKGQGKALRYPQFRGQTQLRQTQPTRFHAVTGLPYKKAGEMPPHLAWHDNEKIARIEGVAEDLTLATRNALINLIDYVTETHGLSPEQAYVLASCAVDLRIGQLVDAPNFMVSAILPLDIFDG